MAMGVRSTTSSGVLVAALLLSIAAGAAYTGAAEELDSGAVIYRAGAFEHEPHQKLVMSRSGAIEMMMKNLADFKNVTEQAKREHDVDIIVFPEDGITGLLVADMKLYAEPMPSVAEITEHRIVPCHDDSYTEATTPVLHFLSCMAAEYSIVVVANMADINTTSGDIYNTDMAFDSDGRLLMKYHKEHLFFEGNFKPGPAGQVAVFRTSFGVTFGMCTCYDILFPSPCQSTIMSYGATELVFPTAWMNAGPLLYSVAIQQSFAKVMGVNVVAANAHIPTFRFTGSGVYAAGGRPIQTYLHRSGDPSLTGKLLVGELRSGQVSSSGKTKIAEPFLVPRAATDASPRLQSTPYRYERISMQSHTARACNGSFCCTLQYDLTQAGQDNSEEHFALGAFSGNVPSQPVKFWAQSCAIVRCPDQFLESCSNASPTAATRSRFTRLTVSARLDSSVDDSHIYPVVMTSGGGLVDMSSGVELQNANGEWTLTIAKPLDITAAGIYAHPDLSGTN